MRLTYPVEREFPHTWRYFAPITVSIAAIIFTILAVLNAVLVGYDTVTVFKPNFNITQSFWFDRFLPRGVGRSKPGTLCGPTTLNPGDSFTTNYSLFQWDLVTVSGSKPSDKSLVYGGSSLESCDARTLYMDAHMQDRSGDLAIVIECDNIDGFKILAKTSFSVTLLSGRYAPPLLGAIPENVPFAAGNSTEASRSTFLNNMLQYARDDFTPLWNDILRGPNPHPIILSGQEAITPCPASSGIDAPCATEPPYIPMNTLTVVFSDASHGEYSQDIPELLGPAIYNATINLAQTLLAAVRIDLGNPSPNNFLLNASVVNTTIHSTINSTESKLYYEITNQQNDIPAMEGPATIRALYSCRLQQSKTIGSAIVSVLVATLSMFTTGWGIFILLSAKYAERVNPRKSQTNFCQNPKCCERQPLLQGEPQNPAKEVAGIPSPPIV